MSRVAPSAPGALYPSSPVIAFAQPWSGANDSEHAATLQVIFHSITDDGMQLIHASPLPPGKLQIRLALAGGELLGIVVKAVATTKRVDLYETSVAFIDDAADLSEPVRSARPRRAVCNRSPSMVP